MSDLIRAIKKPFVTVGFSNADYIIGSGNTNDQNTTTQTIINNALSAVSATGGGTVLLKAGTYYLKTPGLNILDNCTLMGEGFSTILVYATGSAYNGLISNSLAAAGFGTIQYNIVVKDLYINGNSANATGSDPRDMIFLSDVYNSIVTNVHVYDCPDSAIVLDNDSENCIVSHNIVDTTGDIGIYISDTIKTLVTGNQVRNTGSYGIRLIKYNSPYASHCSISNNIVDNCGQGLSVDGIVIQDGAEQNNITGNVVLSSGRYGIHLLNSAYNNVSGNHVSLSDQYGIYVGSVGRSSITGNHCHRNGQSTSNTYSGIYLLNSSDVTVTGNRSADIGSGTRQKYGIEESGTSDNNVISSNMLDRNGTAGLLVTGANTIYGLNRV